MALSCLTLASTAQALDLWSAPHAGLRHLHRFGNGQDLHVMLVDLDNPEVAVVATRPEDRFITTTEFARRYDTEVAINANFYGRGSCGLAMGDGVVFERAYEDGCGASLGFGRANESSPFDSLNIPRGPAPATWIREVLSGKPWLLRDGRAPTAWVRPQHIYRPNPRTAVGLTGDRRTLVLLAADGRRPGVPGLTGFQLVAALREFGVTDAVNLDGGGSTTMVVDGRIANHPSDRVERSVMTHLGVRVRPGAVWWAGEVTARGSTQDNGIGETRELWVEARNTGRRPWRPVTEGGGSPVLELHDGATSYTASVDRVTNPGEVGRFTLRWLPRRGGQHPLRARLALPDGGLLVADALSFDVAVRDTVKPPPSRLAAPPAVATAGLGLGGCHTTPSGPTRSAWAVLGVLGAAVAACRRRVRAVRG